MCGFRGYTLAYASDELKNDKEVVRAAVSHNPGVIKLASQELQHDKDFVLGLVKRDHLVYESLPEEIRKDPTITYHACFSELCGGAYNLDKPNFVDTFVAAPKEIKDLMGNDLTDISGIENAHLNELRKIAEKMGQKLAPPAKAKVLSMDDILKKRA